MSNKNILLIDDETAIRQLLDQMLSEQGFRVVSAENGQDGLEKLAIMPRPRVILLDLGMPVLSGWEFLARLRASPRQRNIPVIVTSASGVAQPPGATGILPKPFGLTKLLTMIRSVPTHPAFAIR